MQSWFTWLLAINSSDENVQRRGRNLVILLLAQFGAALFFLPSLLFSPQAGASLPVTFASLMMYVIIFLMARRGLVTVAAFIRVVGLLIAVLSVAVSTGRLTVTPFFLLVSLLMAGLTLRPWQIWVVLLINALGLALTIFALPNNPMTDPLDSQVIPTAFVLMVIIALLSFVGAKTTDNALRAAERARHEAEQAAQALQQANTSLELAIAERTSSLEQALRAGELREAQLAKTLAENEQQRIAIHEMSVPVIPINATTMVMPLIGALDTARLADVQARAAHSIERSHTRYLLLDITGVPIIDSQVAKGILAVVQSARLLGSEAILIGTRPAVAQTMVGPGVDLGGMRTFSDLQSALARLGERLPESARQAG
jgi:rsbT co-antagonist protein RsbR